MKKILVKNKINTIDVSGINKVSNKIVEFCTSMAQNSYLNGKYEASMNWVYFAATVAWSIHPGFFYNKKLEILIKQISNQAYSAPVLKNVANKSDKLKRQVLHVISTVSGIGGHTRAAAMWIKNSNKFLPGQIHHLCITQQRITQIPSWLVTIVKENGGKVFILPKAKGFIEKAKILREMSNNMELIVLYIHPNDPIANLALSDFQMPAKVIFFNHADHTFSFGGDISDAVFDFRPSGQRITMSRRGCQASYLVPIPLVQEPKIIYNHKLDKEKVRQKFGIDSTDHILITIGDEYKYKAALGYDFKRCVRKILEKNQLVKIYAIGIPNKGEWKQLSKETSKRFIPLGRIKEKILLEDYLTVADIYMEGFPFGSLTAMLEAGLHCLPIQRMQNLQAPILSGDDVALDKIVSIATDEEKYVQGVLDLVNEPIHRRNNLGLKIRESIINNHCGENWVRSYLEPAIRAVSTGEYFAGMQNDIDLKVYKNEINSLTLFQLANNGTRSITVSALANSSVSIFRLFRMTVSTAFNIRQHIPGVVFKEVSILLLMIIMVRFLPEQSYQWFKRLF